MNKVKEEGEENVYGNSSEEDQLQIITEDDIDLLEKETNEKKRILAKTTSMKLGCLGMLNTIYSRLGLPEQPNLTITPEFL